MGRPPDRTTVVLCIYVISNAVVGVSTSSSGSVGNFFTEDRDHVSSFMLKTSQLKQERCAASTKRLPVRPKYPVGDRCTSSTAGTVQGSRWA